MQLIINQYQIKSNQNLVHYLSCQAVRRTACSSRVLEDLGLDYITAQVKLTRTFKTIAEKKH